MIEVLKFTNLVSFKDVLSHKTKKMKKLIEENVGSNLFKNPARNLEGLPKGFEVESLAKQGASPSKNPARILEGF